MKWLFKKKKTEKMSFHTGTDGQRKHDNFLKWVNDEQVKIIHAYTTFYPWEKSKHIPEFLNYIVQY